jgi:DeoR family transcriptional regulator, aga operon transcriptional repressor
MVSAAHRVVAVCDSTKFKRRSLSRIVPPSAVHCVITDVDLPDETAEVLRVQGIEVVLV